MIAKRLIGHVDNSAYPLLNVDIAMTVVTPANARGPVPVLMMFGPSRLPAPAQPPPDDLERINAALKQLLVQVDTSLRAVFERYRAYEPLVRTAPSFPSPAAGGAAADPPTPQQLLAAGWGYAYIDPSSIQADNGAGLTKGIIGLVNKGQPRKPGSSSNGPIGCCARYPRATDTSRAAVMLRQGLSTKQPVALCRWRSRHATTRIQLSASSSFCIFANCLRSPAATFG